jgi:tRNA threonylcarbamoyladenosine biosynthesis protein TsaB
MEVIGIDTSTFGVNLGVISYGHPILNLFIKTCSPSAEFIVELMEKLNYQVEKVDCIGISLGPGSFTSLRVGLATAKGLALGLGKPIVGVSTLDAIGKVGVRNFKSKVVVIIDAKGGMVFYGIYKMGKKVEGVKVIKVEELLEKLPTNCVVVGEGVEAYRSVIERKLNGKVEFLSPNISSPYGIWVAELAREKYKNGEVDNIDSLQPIYIRPPRIGRK